MVAAFGWRVVSRELLARTLWGEARGEGARGMQAVGNVIMNRSVAPAFGGNVPAVVLARKQFSAWNPGDPNRDKLLGVDDRNPAFKSALAIADGLLDGRLPDITGGANHYHTANIARLPSWADASKVTARIGGHIFYRL